MNHKKNIARTIGTISLVAGLILSPLLGVAHAQTVNPPSINGLSAPTQLLVNEMGSWTIKASDPNNGNLSYAADWGDSSTAQPVFASSPTLTHNYSAPGTYTANFTVKDNAGLVTHTSATVFVENEQGTPLVISNATVAPTNPTGERITWDTNTRANSSVWISTSTPVDTSGVPHTFRFARVFHHNLVLNNLAAGTTYFVVAGSRDINRNFATSSEMSFTTAAAPLTAPANVTGTADESSATLTWDASTGGIAPITYSIMRDGTSVGTTTDTTFTDTDLSPDTAYSYVIEATDSATPPTVADSAAVSVTTATATPTIVSVSGPATLPAGTEGTWTLGSSDPLNGTLTYAVDWGDTPASALRRAATMLIQTSTFSHTYANAGTYNIIFTATNEAGLSTTSSTSVTVTAVTVPLTAPSITDSTSTDTTVGLTWSAATGGVAPISYSVMRDGVSVGTTTDTTFTDTGLTASTTYNYVIEAADSATPTSSVADSAAVAVTTLTSVSAPLTAPANVTGTADESSATLTWDASTGGIAPITYSIMRDGTSVGTTTDTTFTDTDLSPDTAYSYVIEATDSATPPTVADSAAVSVTTATATPTIVSVSGPATLPAGTEGTWTLGSSDPLNGTLTYAVDWGDTPASALRRAATMLIQTSTFSHTYANAGTYNIIFTATNEAGLSTTSSTSVTVTAVTVPLTAPSITDSTSTDTTVGLTWSAATGGVAPISYSVMRDGVSVGTTTDTTFTDTGLTASTTYNYVIEAADSATPTSSVADSAAVAVTTLTSVSAAPVISAVSATPATSTAVIAWTTDVPSDSTVWASTSTPVDTTVAPTMTDATLTTSHSLTLVGLDANTTYNYVIASTNAASIMATSSESSFTTPAPEAATFTLADVALHNTSNSCWTAINGSVYDLTSFIGSHPGGIATISSICGIDGTAAFNAIHGEDTIAMAELVPLKIGILGV